MEKMKDIDYIKEKIIEKLIEKGYYCGQEIDYNELHILHKEYGQGLSEMLFSRDILDISEHNYRNCKNGIKTKILKKYEKIIIKEKAPIIIQKLKEAGYYPGQMLTYDQIQELYKIYGVGLKEIIFAQHILKISKGNYSNCKNKGKRARILSEKEEKISEDEKQEIIEKMKKTGYYPGQFVTYDQIQELYTIYGNGLKEGDFAQEILGITNNDYSNCKYKKLKVKILETEIKMITKEERQEIIEKMKKTGYYPGQFVTYDQIQELYTIYGKGLEESDFIHRILGINDDNYRVCRIKKTKVKILKTEIVRITEEERQEIIKKIKNAGYYSGQLMTYDQIQKLYTIYGKGLEESDFIYLILGIRYDNYKACRNQKTKVKILKTKEKTLTEAERQKIIDEIIEAGYYPGKNINYKEFKVIFEKYGQGLKEDVFARKILGILYGNYSRCKNEAGSIMINDGIKFEKANEIISLYITASQYYDEEYIEEICRKYNITIDDFIKYVYFHNYYDTTPFKEALKKNKKLWIGKEKMSVEFVKENIEKIEKIAFNVSQKACAKYKIKQYEEDFRQELIIYMIENFGSLEKNLGNSDDFFDILSRKLMKNCMYLALHTFKLNIKCDGANKVARTGKNDKDFEIQLPDNTDIERNICDEEDKTETELELESIVDTKDADMYRCISILYQNIKKGMSRNEALKDVGLKMNINQKTMLNYIQKYLTTNGKVEIKKGKISFREH